MVTALAVGRERNLLAAAMLTGIYSLLSACWMTVLDAPDVAYTEAAVGAGISTVLMLGALYLTRGDGEQARGSAEQALRIAEPAHDQQITVAAKVQLARAIATSDPAAASRLIDEASTAETSLDAAEVWSVKALLLLERGNRADAYRAAEHSAEVARTRRDRFALASALEVAAMATTAPDTARRGFDEARALFEELGCVLDADRVEVRIAFASAGAAGAVDPVSAARLGAIIDTARRRGARAPPACPSRRGACRPRSQSRTGP